MLPHSKALDGALKTTQKFTELSTFCSSANDDGVLKRTSERTVFYHLEHQLGVVYGFSTLNTFSICLPDIIADLAKCWQSVSEEM